MKHSKFSWMAASFLVILLCAIPVGYDVISSYKNNTNQEIASEAVEDASKTVECASETNEKFYKKMVAMKRNSTLIFNGFPTCLTDILSHRNPGDEILTTGTDTLYLVDWDLNRTDINRYPCYIVKDNHDNLWSIFRHNENFHLNRVDEVKHKDWLEIRKPNYENWPWKLTKNPQVYPEGFT